VWALAFLAWTGLGCVVLCSKFGISFARAAESLGVGYRQEMFESSFLELGKAHVTAFMRILEEVMNDGSRAAYANGGAQTNRRLSFNLYCDDACDRPSVLILAYYYVLDPSGNACSFNSDTLVLLQTS